MMEEQLELIFSNYKDAIIESLEKKVSNGIIVFPTEEKFSLMPGFVFSFFFPVLEKKTLPIGGDSALICIAMVGEQSGQVYYFSLKSLLPDLFNTSTNED